MFKKFPKNKLPELLARLGDMYPVAECALVHRNAFELLAATILSAQCTDKRVNIVTPALFERYPSPSEMAQAAQSDVEELIRTTGFFRNKAKSLIGMAQGLMNKHGGEVPRTIEELVELPGVARKTANVVLGTCFGIPSGVVVDTHVSRITQRLGLTSHTDPVKIERDLMTLLPRDQWIIFSHRLIHHGRGLCNARAPQCKECPLLDLCPTGIKLTS